MRTQAQSNSDLGQLARLIDGMKVAMLTSRDDRGALVSRPMAPLEMDGDGALWFLTDARLEKADTLTSVNLSFSDDARAIYVSVTGRATLVYDREHIAALWTPLERPWFPEGANAEPLVLLKVEPDVVEYWDAPHSKLLRLLAMAASAVADLPQPRTGVPRVGAVRKRRAVEAGLAGAAR